MTQWRIRLDQTIAQFLDTHDARTQEHYDLQLRRLTDYLNRFPVEEITLRVLRDWQAWLEKRDRYMAHPLCPVEPGGLGDVSRRHAAIAIRKFFAWAHERGLWPDNPAADLPIPRVVKRLPRALTASQVEALLQACDVNTPIGRRDLAVLVTLIETGCRLTELITLRRDSVQFINDGTLLYITDWKTSREEPGFLLPDGTAVVRRYLADWPKVPRTGPLFVSMRLGREGKDALGVQGVDGIIKKAAAQARIDRALAHAHTLRHTMASLMTNNGAPARIVQVLAGWSDVRMLEVYTHHNVEGLQRAHQQWGPLVGVRVPQPPEEEGRQLRLPGL